MNRCKEWLWSRITANVRETIEKLNIKLRGYYRYYGITDNIERLKSFRGQVLKYLFRVLKRRSQKHHLTWDKYTKFLDKFPIEKPKIYVNIMDIRIGVGYNL